MKIVWTESMQERLAELAADPLLSYGRIAQIMSIEFRLAFSKNSCVGRANRSDLPKPTSPLPPPGPRARARNGLKLLPQSEPEPRRAGSYLIHQLRSHHCRYPYGDRAPFAYCGLETNGSSSYCAQHFRLVYQVPKARAISHHHLG